jgi:hypothetical protein
MSVLHRFIGRAHLIRGKTTGDGDAHLALPGDEASQRRGRRLGTRQAVRLAAISTALTNTYWAQVPRSKAGAWHTAVCRYRFLLPLRAWDDNPRTAHELRRLARIR